MPTFLPSSPILAYCEGLRWPYAWRMGLFLTIFSCVFLEIWFGVRVVASLLSFRYQTETVGDDTGVASPTAWNYYFSVEFLAVWKEYSELASDANALQLFKEKRVALAKMMMTVGNI